MNLDTIIASALEEEGVLEKGYAPLRTGGAVRPEFDKADHLAVRVAGAGGVTAAAPVFQLEALPLTLNPERYANPASNSNPDGDYRSLAAFRSLVDPVPAFTRYYGASGKSTEQAYGELINGANVPGGTGFASQVIANGQKKYSESYFANLGGLPGIWRPVYSIPDDWYDIKQQERFRRVQIDLTADGPSLSGLSILPGTAAPATLEWRLGDPKAPSGTVPLDPRTEVKSIALRALRVSFDRPWMTYEVFDIGGWYLAGQPAGLYSSGELDANDGIMPLLPTAMVIGTDLEVVADWNGQDRDILQRAAAGTQPVALGPFALATGNPADPLTVLPGNAVSTAALQVVGWISTLVPFAPKQSALTAHT